MFDFKTFPQVDVCRKCGGWIATTDCECEDTKLIPVACLNCRDWHQESIRLSTGMCANLSVQTEQYFGCLGFNARHDLRKP